MEKSADNNSKDIFNSKGELIVVGCNYHTTWQSNKGMRFVLKEVLNEKAKLITRTTKKEFMCKVDDLIFITTEHNKRKAKQIKSKNNNERTRKTRNN